MKEKENIMTKNYIYNFLTSPLTKPIPKNIFFHGRSDDSHIKNAEYIIMATQDPHVADSYGRGGIIWMINLPDNTPESNQIVTTVFNKLQEDFNKGTLSYEVEIYANYSLDDFKDAFDIENILDAGQAWDNWEFVEWFKHAFPKINAVILPNGHYGDRATVIIRPKNVEVLGMNYYWEPKG